jgi:hypothetical protein
MNFANGFSSRALKATGSETGRQNAEPADSAAGPAA